MAYGEAERTPVSPGRQISGRSAPRAQRGSAGGTDTRRRALARDAKGARRDARSVEPPGRTIAEIHVLTIETILPAGMCWTAFGG